MPESEDQEGLDSDVLVSPLGGSSKDFSSGWFASFLLGPTVFGGEPWTEARPLHRRHPPEIRGALSATFSIALEEQLAENFSTSQKVFGCGLGKRFLFIQVVFLPKGLWLRFGQEVPIHPSGFSPKRSLASVWARGSFSPVFGKGYPGTRSPEVGWDLQKEIQVPT